MIEKMENLRQRLARLMRERMRATLVDTQTKVSAKAGIAQSTVQRLLSLDQSATLDVLESLAKAFGIKNSEYLLLEHEEAKLLTMWASLTEEDRSTVLGFIQMKAQVSPSQAQLHFESQTQVPLDLVAASKRASIRSTAEQEGKADDGKTNEPRTRRKA